MPVAQKSGRKGKVRKSLTKIGKHRVKYVPGRSFDDSHWICSTCGMKAAARIQFQKFPCERSA